MIEPKLALKLLKEGNHHYVNAIRENISLNTHVATKPAIEGQQPFAIILGCSDSRAPLELTFNQSIGDLFIVRVAGNIATPSQLGSIEYACEHLGSKLIVILGHSHCGAVAATLDSIKNPSAGASPNIGALVRSIKGAAESVIDTNPNARDADLLSLAVTANVKQVVTSISDESELLRAKIDSGEVMVVGAEYDIETGEVIFYD